MNKRTKLIKVYKRVASCSEMVSILISCCSEDFFGFFGNKSRTFGRDDCSSGFVVVAYSPIYSGDFWYVPLKSAAVNGVWWRLGSCPPVVIGLIDVGETVPFSSVTDGWRHGRTRSAAVVPVSNYLKIDIKKHHV